MNIREFVNKITGISTPFFGISWDISNKNNVDNTVRLFVAEWEKRAFGNPVNINQSIGPEEHNLMKLTAQLYAQNLINGELDKTKHLPDIIWDEEYGMGVCYAQMTSGYILGRYLDKGHFDRVSFPDSIPQGFDNFTELCSRWFEGVMSIDWVNILGDKFLVEIANTLGGRVLIDGLFEEEKYINSKPQILGTMRCCFLLGVILYRYLMSGAPKLTFENA